MSLPAVGRIVDSRARVRKKVEEARRLRDVPPEESLRLGFSLIRFARRVSEAADRAGT